jgi:hypothetical protein
MLHSLIIWLIYSVLKVFGEGVREAFKNELFNQIFNRLYAFFCFYLIHFQSFYLYCI